MSPLSISTRSLPDVLDAEQEVELCLAMEAGLVARAVLDGVLAAPAAASVVELEQLVAVGEQAWQHFLEANLRMVRSLAWEAHRRSGIEVDELLQEGFLGLAEAVRRFDVRQGVRFSTYGFGWVRNAVLQCQLRRGGAVETPVHRARQAQQLRRRRAELEGNLGRLVGLAELAADVGRPVAWVQQMLVGDQGPLTSVPVEELPVPCLAAQRALEACEQQEPGWLAELGSVEARVLRLRFGLGDGVERSYQSCARALGVSTSTVRRVERAALTRARHLLAGDTGQLAA